MCHHGQALNAVVNPWTALNFVILLVPGPIGLAVDIATGAVQTLEPTEATFFLEKADSTTTTKPPACTGR